MDKEKKQFPMGISDYVNTVTNYYYLDKTLLIKDLLGKPGQVSLVTRPRRFGKSLNMDMIKTFFEKTGDGTPYAAKNTERYFMGKKIYSEKKCMKEQGRYPVIFITFKDANKDTWDKTFFQIKKAISNEYKRHTELLGSGKVYHEDLEIYNQIRGRKAEDGDYDSAIETLARMLRAHYGIPPVILIDEYDVPIQKGYDKGYYDEAVDFMRGLFSSGLKDSKDMYFAYLTGVTRVSEESIFSGLNNLNVYSILDDELSEYFGFTGEEVRKILRYYGHDEKMNELMEWYDGYDIGGRQMFNPWSVMKYIEAKCRPDEYWTNTSENGTIGKLLTNASKETVDKLMLLLQGSEISCKVNKNTVFPGLEDDPDNVFTLLLFSGYLKSVGKDEDMSNDMGDRYRLMIPNKEIKRVFLREIVDRLTPKRRKDILECIWSAILREDEGALDESIGELLENCESFFDAREAFYHGMCLGLFAYKYSSYKVKSNRESGDGRYDIALEPLSSDRSVPAVIIEVKAIRKKDENGNENGVSDEALKSKAIDARCQIDEMNYEAELNEDGFFKIVKVGLAFFDKKMRSAMRLPMPVAESGEETV